MYVTWHGLSCVRIQSKEVTVLVDPLPTTVGLAAPRLQADLFVFTTTENPQHAKARKGEALVIDSAGEFEVRGITVNGVAIDQPGGQSMVVYTFEAEGMVIGHLGALGTPMNGPQVELLKDIDVLFVPVGGKPVLSAKQATELLSVLEPRIVIPMYYRLPGLTTRLEGVESFLKELGVKNAVPQDKLRLVRKELPEGEMQVKLLKV